jgi:FMN phosphatase YigB (HAD superfamily)
VKALLIDFDNTLVLFNEDTFLVNYAQASYPYLAEFFDQSTFFQKLLQSTLQMIRNDGKMTNAEVFTRHFISDTSKLGFEECQNRFRQFYEESFHQLGEIVQIVPYGRKLLQRVIQEGLQVVIATNPIFPEIATQIRLEWGNIADLDITLSTHGENMSYCKPRPEYYQAILDLINQKPEACVMAGNDPVSDMAASVLGITTFLIDLDQKKGRLGILSKEIEHRTKQKEAAAQYRVDGSGTLEDLEQFLFVAK